LFSVSRSILNWRRFTRAWVLPSSVIWRFMALIELLVEDPGYGKPFAKVINFPWGMTLFIARDEPLMEQVLAGRFDFLANNDQDGLGWLQRLRAAHRLMAGNLDPR
jgi:hypothetical protein